MRYLIVFFVFMLSMFSWGQKLDLVFRGTLVNSDKDKKEEGVKVRLVQAGTVISSSVTSSNGKFKISADIDQTKPFELKFSKPGLVGKMMHFDFAKLNEEDTPPGGELFDPFEIKVFNKRDNADFSFLKTEPVAKFDWNAQALSPRLNTAAAAAVKKKVEVLLADSDKRKAEMNMKYNAALKAADAFYASKNYEKALRKYEEALGYKPQAKYPVDKIIELDALIQVEKASVLADKQENEAYYNLIEAGDNLRDQDNLEGAILKYKAGLEKKDEQYPKDQIAVLTKTLELRKKEARNNKMYDTAISSGDAFLKQNSLRAAKDKYTEAARLKPTKQYPKAKLVEIETKMGDLAREKAYKAAVSTANELFGKGMLEAAKSEYKKAIAIDESNTFPKAQIALVDKAIADLAKAKNLHYDNLMLVAEKAKSAGSFQKAILKYKEAQSVKPLETLPAIKITELEAMLEKEAASSQLDKQYNKLIREGDVLVANKKYIEAINKYNKALVLKPMEQGPVDKAEEAERLEKAKGQETDAQYEKILTVAEKKIESKEYDRALELIDRAIKFKPEDSRPQDLLAKVNAIKSLDKKYAGLMNSASVLMSKKKFEEAKKMYNNARKLKPKEPEPKIQIAEINALMSALSKANKKDSLYTSYIEKGQRNFDKKDYSAALRCYQKALLIIPTDLAAKSKVSEIKQLMDDIKDSKANRIIAERLNAIIKEADSFFEKKEYARAKNKYEEAIVFSPSHLHAKNRIEACERLSHQNERVEVEVKPENTSTVLSSGVVENVGVEKLEDLGVPFDENSILEGGFIIQKAESDRRFSQSTSIDIEAQKIRAAETKRGLAETKFHERELTTLRLVQQQAKADENVYALNSEFTDAELKKVQLEVEKTYRTNVDFENSDNLSSQGVLDRKTEESLSVYSKRQNAYKGNADNLKLFNDAQAALGSKRISQDYNERVNSTQTISIIEGESHHDKTIKSTTNKQLNEAKAYASQARVEASADRYDELLTNEGAVQESAIRVVEKAQSVSARLTGSTNDLEGVRAGVVADNNERTSIDVESAFKVNSQVSEIQKRAQDEQFQLGEDRAVYNALIQQQETELAGVNIDRYNTEVERHFRSKELVDESIRLLVESGVLRQEEQADQVHEHQLAKDQAYMDLQTFIEDDEGDRLNTQQQVDRVDMKSTEITRVLKDKEALARQVAAVDEAVKKQSTEVNKTSKDKHYDAYQKIEGVSDAPKKPIKVANSLGKEYPEGVSQESFSKSDADGLVTTIFTRRVVVIDGHADVYVRTQTLSGITYSKNGNPIVSHVWQKETQSAHLERHF